MAEIPPALARAPVERGQVSRKVRSEERREQVLERMTAVFAKRGYQAATVDHLIAGGKISMGGFYKDFSGKEDCFVQVYDRVIGQLMARWVDALSEESGWADQVAIGQRTLVEMTSEDPLAARVILLEAQTGGPLALARYNEMLARSADLLRGGRGESAEAARLPASFEDATISGLLWLLQSRIAQGRIEDAGELWPHMAKMALEPYIGAARADQVIRANS
jgi:AcrR family transcriptional regulator